MALVYNDISPLESYHVSTCFRIARRVPGADFDAPLPPEAKTVLRASIIDLILGEAHPP